MVSKMQQVLKVLMQILEESGKAGKYVEAWYISQVARKLLQRPGVIQRDLSKGSKMPRRPDIFMLSGNTILNGAYHIVFPWPSSSNADVHLIFLLLAPLAANSVMVQTE